MKASNMHLLEQLVNIAGNIATLVYERFANHTEDKPHGPDMVSQMAALAEQTALVVKTFEDQRALEVVPPSNVVPLTPADDRVSTMCATHGFSCPDGTTCPKIQLGPAGPSSRNDIA